MLLLLLLPQAFKLQGLLTGQQEELLRILACQHDTRLLKAYETVSRWDHKTYALYRGVYVYALCVPCCAVAWEL
jgi:hypothetical protein